jgi:hypothetical protein
LRVSKIADVNMVADADAIRRVVIGAINCNTFAARRRSVEDERDEMGLGIVVLPRSTYLDRRQPH